MCRLNRISSQYHTEISSALRRFRDHEGIRFRQITKWIGQFEDAHLEVASKILNQIRYYASSNIREMTRKLCRVVINRFSDIRKDRIAFVSLGEPGSGSEIIMRALREVREARGCHTLRMLQLDEIEPGQLSLIVFIDDFSGTGDRLTSWWESVEAFVRPINALVVVALLVLNYRAEPAIADFSPVCICIDRLNESDNVFSECNQSFSQDEKRVLRDYCGKTRCSVDFLEGYGRCGLLLSFRHGCPNDSIPILWWGRHGWHPLFKRWAI